DGPVITGSVIIPGKVTISQSLLGKVPDKFESETKLGIYYTIHIILRDLSGHAIECGIGQWLSTSTAVVDLVATIVLTSQGDQPIYIPVGDEISYADTNVISCILPEVLCNRQMWDAKVLLIVYVTVKIQKIDKVLRQFADTAAIGDYLPWFKVVGKSYLLSPERSSGQIQTNRSHRPQQHIRR
ncbi:hypothetical protein Goshw_004358, partial [Gossypium schwendimanii]|nr:hypothetical protein [Gossypium schwendimanii]